MFDFSSLMGMLPQVTGATTGFGATTQGYLAPQMPQTPVLNPDIIPAQPTPQVASAPLPPLPQAGVDPMTTQPVQNPAQGMMSNAFGALAQKQEAQNRPETLGQAAPIVGSPYQGLTQTSRMEPKSARNSRMGANNFAGLLGGYFG